MGNLDIFRENFERIGATLTIKIGIFEENLIRNLKIYKYTLISL